MKPAGAILLAIGAGGGLKQVLVGMDLPIRWPGSRRRARCRRSYWLVDRGGHPSRHRFRDRCNDHGGWIMPGAIKASGCAPEWTVLAIGPARLFSHVK